jgi:hypothetical protein
MNEKVEEMKVLSEQMTTLSRRTNVFLVTSRRNRAQQHRSRDGKHSAAIADFTHNHRREFERMDFLHLNYQKLFNVSLNWRTL